MSFAGLEFKQLLPYIMDKISGAWKCSVMCSGEHSLLSYWTETDPLVILTPNSDAHLSHDALQAVIPGGTQLCVFDPF